MTRKHLREARDLRRRAPFRQARKKFLILCEGAVTEHKYFLHIRQQLRYGPAKIVVSNECGEPLRLVEVALAQRDNAERQARRERDDSLRYDEVWCVVDVDAHARLPQALALAAKEGIGVAVSNPCFELWPLLHFAPHRKSCSADELRAVLRKHLPDYEKELDHRRLQGAYADARARALELERLHTQAGRHADANPSTSVWAVVDSLLQATRSGAALPSTQQSL